MRDCGVEGKFWEGEVGYSWGGGGGRNRRVTWQISDLQRLGRWCMEGGGRGGALHGRR